MSTLLFPPSSDATTGTCQPGAASRNRGRGRRLEECRRPERKMTSFPFFVHFVTGAKEEGGVLGLGGLKGEREGLSGGRHGTLELSC